MHSLAVGEDLLHLIQGLQIQPLRAAIDAAFQGSTPSLEVEANEPAGDRPLHLRLLCQPLPPMVENDTVDGVAIIVIDITDLAITRRQLEQQLGRAGADVTRLEAAVERLAEANRALLEGNQELTSVNVELQSANEEFLISNEEAQAAAEEIETLNEELQATNEELETLNEELQATVEELNTTNEDLQARSLEVQDVALTLEAQRQESEAARRQLEAILATMSDAVMVVGGDGRITLRNAAYAARFGDELPAAQDARGVDLPAEELPQRRAARGEDFELEFTARTLDGERRWFEASGSPLRHGGVQPGGVVVIRDITERSLRRFQERFVALASHELRSPLTALRGYLQLLDRGLDPEAERQRGYAQAALAQAGELAALVDDLQDLSRADAGEFPVRPERLDLLPLVLEVAEVARALTAQRLELETPDAPVLVDGDPRRLRQVLLNLLTNAVRYAPGSERIVLRLRAAGGEAEMQVQDFGPGIPAAELPDLFTRYFRLARDRQAGGQGLGLGLFISRALIRAQGGSIDVQSEEGAGTTFTIRLPLAPAPPGPSSPNREGGS